MIEFLVCALALPAANFRSPPIVSYHAMSADEDQLRDWIKKNNPGAEVFIHPEPEEEFLKHRGWERVPFRINDKQIWIRRKPHSDAKKRMIETSS